MTNLPTNTKTIDRFTPPFYDGEDNPPIYLLRTPSLMERAAFRRDLRAAGAVYPGDAEMFEAMREGVKAIAPANLDALLADIDEAAEVGLDKADLELKDRFSRIVRQLRSFHADFAGIEGDREYFLMVAPIVACRHFLVGWENVDAPFERRNGVTADACLQAIPERDLMTAGFRALNLMNLSEKQRKNSASPSSSPNSPPPSGEASGPSTAGADGKSSGKRTKSTPAS